MTNSIVMFIICNVISSICAFLFFLAGKLDSKINPYDPKTKEIIINNKLIYYFHVIAILLFPASIVVLLAAFSEVYKGAL